MRAASPLTYRPADILAAFSLTEDEAPPPRSRALLRLLEDVIGASRACGTKALHLFALEDALPSRASRPSPSPEKATAGSPGSPRHGAGLPHHIPDTGTRSISHFAPCLPWAEPPLPT